MHRSAAPSTLPGHLLHLLYDGVTLPVGFQPFIEALADSFSLKGVALIIRHAEQSLVKATWMCGIDAGAMEAYTLNYAQEDLLVHHLEQAPIAHFYASNLHLDSPERILSTRFYREWLQPHGIARAAGSIILREDGWVTQIMVQRAFDQPDFTLAEIEAFNELQPHLQRALQMRQRISQLEVGQNVLIGGLDALAIPTFLVDENGRHAWHNRQAQGLLEKQLLSSVAGHLTLADGTASRQLNMAITEALALLPSIGRYQPRVIQVPRHNRLPLTLVVTPLSYDRGQGRQRGAVIFAHNPEQARRVSAEQVRQLFNLSRAEAELAVLLCEGMSLEECARARHISIHTVRTQLRSVFAKTGTARQSELLALLFTSPAYFIVAQDEVWGAGGAA